MDGGDKDAVPGLGVEDVAGGQEGIPLPGLPATGQRLGRQVGLAAEVLWRLGWI